MIEVLSLAGILAVGSLAFWGFWLAVIIAFFVLIGLTENEHYGWASVLFGVGFVLLGVTGIFNVYSFAIQHPGALIGRVLGYIGIGVVWGAIKWWRYCVKQRKLYEAAKTDFLKANKVKELTPELRVEWTQKLQEANRYSRHYVLHSEAPDWSENKEKIMNWMYLWPFSVFGTVFSDFVLRLWKNICEYMGGVYDSIAASVWKGTENDLASEEDLAAAKAKAEEAAQNPRRQGNNAK